MPTRTAPRSLLLIAYFIFFVMAIPGSVLNVAWTYMQVTFAVPFDSLGILLLTITGGGLFTTFISGRLIERFGMGRYLLSGGVLIAIGLLGYVLAPSWIALLAAAFVATLGFSAFNTGLNNFISVRYTTGQFNWLHAAYGLGQTIGPALVTFTVERMGQSWHLSYLLVFVLMLVILPLLFYTRAQWMMPGEAAPDASRPGKTERVSLWESLRIPAVLLGMSIFFVSSGVILGTGQLSEPLLTGRGVAEAGFWISAYWGSFTVGRIIMGFIAHRLDNTMLLRASLAGGAVGALLLWQNDSTGVNLLGLMVMGLAYAPLYPTLIAETHRRVAQRYRLNGLGFQMAAGGLGQAVIPSVIALAAQHISLSVIAPLIVIGALVAFALHEAAVRQRQVAPAVTVT